MTRTYNRGRYYAQSTSSRLYESQEAHGKTLEQLKAAQDNVRMLELVVSHVWYFGDYCPTRNCDLCMQAIDIFSKVGEIV